MTEMFLVKYDQLQQVCAAGQSQLWEEFGGM